MVASLTLFLTACGSGSDESIRASVCVFTAAASQQFGGDPLVFRTDVVTGRDAATVRRDFGTNCGLVSGLT